MPTELGQRHDPMLAGASDTGTAIPRDDLLRMFDPRGNPPARDLLGVISYLWRQASVRLQVTLQSR